MPYSVVVGTGAATHLYINERHCALGMMTVQKSTSERLLQSRGISRDHADWDKLLRGLADIDAAKRDRDAVPNFGTPFPPKDGAKYKQLAIKYDFELSDARGTNVISVAAIDKLRRTIDRRIKELEGQFDLDLLRAKDAGTLSGSLIFWSWQSDYYKSRREIEDVLETSIAGLNSRLSESDRLTIERAARAEDGAVDIVANILRRIQNSQVLVADVTAICRLPNSNKVFPNPNVCFEIGHALTTLTARRVILVARRRPEPEFHAGEMPFDFSKNRLLLYQGKSDLTKKLPVALEGLLAANGFQFLPPMQ